MSSHTFPETSVLPVDPWIAPWVALTEYRNQVVDIWLAALSDWPFFPHASGSTAESGSRLLPEPKEGMDQTKPIDQAKEAQSESTEPPREMPQQVHVESQPHAAGKPIRKRTSRRSTGDTKGPERTGRASPAVMAGLRHRSYSVKLAAVSAMATNKKLRTEEAIPLLQRIVDNQTIRRRDPELRTAAKAVLQQSRQETSRRSAQASSKRSPAKPNSRRRKATV